MIRRSLTLALHRVHVAQKTKGSSLASLEKLAKALRVKVGRLLE